MATDVSDLIIVPDLPNQFFESPEIFETFHSYARAYEAAVAAYERACASVERSPEPFAGFLLEISRRGLCAELRRLGFTDPQLVWHINRPGRRLRQIYTR